MPDRPTTVSSTESLAVAALSPAPQPLSAPPPTDAGLVAQIGQRHEPALGVLYDRHSPLLYILALEITQDAQVAEAVMADVFRAAWLDADNFGTAADSKAWLIRQTRHLALTTLRARHGRVQPERVAADAAHGTQIAHDAAPPVIAEVTREQVHHALANVPAIQRTAIELAYYAGCTCAEIAHRTGVPVGTVKTHLRLGIATLRTGLFPDPQLP